MAGAQPLGTAGTAVAVRHLADRVCRTPGVSATGVRPHDSSFLGPGATVFDHEALEGRDRGALVLTVGNRLEARHHAIGGDVHADVTPLATVEKTNMRIKRQKLAEGVERRAIGGDGAADELGGDGG